MYQTNVILFIILINHSCAILTSSASDRRLTNDNKDLSLNKSDINRSNVKREGLHPYYYSKPHFVHSSHPDNEYNNLYEINHEYEDHVYQHPTGSQPHVHHYNHDKDIAVKALLAPLFGIALLGVVAAMVNNPVLLQLGVLSGRRRRKRRSVAMENDQVPIMIPTAVVDRLHSDLMMIGHILSQMPRSNIRNEEKRLVENYFTCTELGKSLKSNENCIKWLVCELWNDKSDMTLVTSQRAFVKTILGELLSNEHMQGDVRRKIKDAQRFGRENGHCDIYTCNLKNALAV